MGGGWQRDTYASPVERQSETEGLELPSCTTRDVARKLCPCGFRFLPLPLVPVQQPQRLSQLRIKWCPKFFGKSLGRTKKKPFQSNLVLSLFFFFFTTYFSNKLRKKQKNSLTDTTTQQRSGGDGPHAHPDASCRTEVAPSRDQLTRTRSRGPVGCSLSVTSKSEQAAVRRAETRAGERNRSARVETRRRKATKITTSGACARARFGFI